MVCLHTINRIGPKEWQTDLNIRENVDELIYQLQEVIGFLESGIANHHTGISLIKLGIIQHIGDLATQLRKCRDLSAPPIQRLTYSRHEYDAKQCNFDDPWRTITLKGYSPTLKPLCRSAHGIRFYHPDGKFEDIMGAVYDDSSYLPRPVEPNKPDAPYKAIHLLKLWVENLSRDGSANSDSHDMLQNKDGDNVRGLVPWRDKADDYWHNSKAIKSEAAIIDGRSLTLNSLRRLLKSDVPIRYMSKKRRAKVHMNDLLLYCNSKRKNVSGDDVSDFMADAEAKKKEIQEENLKKL